MENKSICYNTECPICLEELSDSPELAFLTSCRHGMHISCIKGLNNTKCQICNQEITNYTKNLLDIIAENSVKRREILENKEREDIINHLLAEYRLNTSNIVPRFEALTAMRYLHSIGIPLIFIPLEINIGIYVNYPLPRRGMIFNAIVTKTIERIIKLIIEKDETMVDVENNRYKFKLPLESSDSLSLNSEFKFTDQEEQLISMEDEDYPFSDNGQVSIIGRMINIKKI